MSQFIALVRLWLATISPELPPAALVVSVFLAIYSVRRWLPRAWLFLEHLVPFVDTVDPTPGLKTLLKFWQALPAAALAAVTGALLGGTSVRIAVWGVVTAALTAGSHELLADYAKFFGQVGGPAKPAVAKKPPSFPPPAAAGLIALCLTLGGCGLAAVVGPYLAEAAVLIADAVNAIDAAQALLPSLHLSESEQAKADAAIGKCRQALAAAAKADDGAKDLTAEQLDASLADFRAAWIDIQVLFASPHIGATAPAYMLPMPLAVKRAER